MDKNKKYYQNFERIESLENELGIRIEGLNAIVQEDDDVISIDILGEVYSTNGSTIDDNIDIYVTAFDAQGRVIETGSSIILADNFKVLTQLSIYLDDLISVPDKIRIYPQKT